MLDLLQAHRSIRAFTNDPIPEHDITQAVRAGQMASTSSAVQAYCAIRITDAQTRAHIADLAGAQDKVRLAPLFMVICADSRRHRIAAARAAKPYHTQLEAFVVAVIDASLFAEKMAIAFEAMGYGICYVGGIRNDLPRLTSLLNLPTGLYPLFGLCAGRPDQSPAQRPRLPIDLVLLNDRYPDDPFIEDRIADYDRQYTAYLQNRGAPPKPWSSLMADQHATPARAGLADFYLKQGAILE